MPLDTDVIVPQDKTPVVRLDLRTSATDSNGLWRLSRTSLNLDRHYLDTSWWTYTVPGNVFMTIVVPDVCLEMS